MYRGGGGAHLSRRRSIQITVYAFHMRLPKHLRYLETGEMEISWPIWQVQQLEVDVEHPERSCRVHLDDEVFFEQFPWSLQEQAETEWLEVVYDGDQ